MLSEITEYVTQHQCGKIPIVTMWSVVEDMLLKCCSERNLTLRNFIRFFVPNVSTVIMLRSTGLVIHVEGMP
jgi:hypothetical protein